jgi:DME family drug/metabolite transporter
MKLIGLSRAMPLSTTYPLFTVLLAVLFLGERISWMTVAGAVSIVAGTYLLARVGANVRDTDQQGKSADTLGVILAFLAALCWSGSTVLLRVGLDGVDVTIANSVRLSLLMIALAVLLFRQRGFRRISSYGLGSLSIVLVAGVVGTGLGTFAYLVAVQKTGAARTSILSASMPLFGLPLSMLLKEKPCPKTFLGTALILLGVWFTIS